MQSKAARTFSPHPLEGQTLAEEYKQMHAVSGTEASRNDCFKKRALQELQIQVS